MSKHSFSVATEFLEVANQYSNNIAVWAKGEHLTYAQLRDRALAIANRIIGSGNLEPGDRVCIIADRTNTLYASVLGVILSGAVYVPLNPKFPTARNSKILAGSGAKIIVSDNANLAQANILASALENSATVIAAETLPEAAYFSDGIRETSQSQSDDDLLYILFTSGSTGEPKGVPISHANLAAYCSNVSEIGSVNSSDRIIQLADITFDISVHDMFVSWLNGASLYSVPENAALMAPRFVSEFGITGWFSVPSTAGILKQRGLLKPNSFESIKFTLFCGEPLTGSVADAWLEAAPNTKLFNLYGPTEATVAFTSYPYQRSRKETPSIVPLGWPFPDQRVGLFDGTGAPVSGSNLGEICLSGSQVAKEYWENRQLTDERFFSTGGQRWYRTGDLGRFDKDEGFLFAGRVDHQTKIRGYRVELQEIEGVIRAASKSELVSVLAWPVDSEKGALSCVAFVADSKSNENAIIELCKDQLPEYMVPSHVYFIDNMPLNSNGKIDRLQLKHRLELGTKHVGKPS